MRVNEKMKKLLSILLCLCMLLQNAPVMAFAATTDNLCDHHTEHTAECGYREGSAGSACAHEHSEDCYAIVVCIHEHDESCGYVAPVEGVACGHTEHTDCGYAPATEGTPCTHVCQLKVDSADSCYKLLCSHKDGSHDDACGYAAPMEGQACTFSCLECSTEPAESTVDEGVTAVQTMIDALPTAESYFAMTVEEQFAAQEALTVAYESYTALSPEQQNQVDTTALYALQEAVMNGGKTLEESTDPTQVSITWCSLEFTYSKIWNPETLQYDSEWTASDDGTITIQNDGTTSIIATFTFESTAGITGTFSVNDLTISAGETKTTQLKLTGKPSEDINTTALGEIKVNVQQCDTE